MPSTKSKSNFLPKKHSAKSVEKIAPIIHLVGVSSVPLMAAWWQMSLNTTKYIDIDFKFGLFCLTMAFFAALIYAIKTESKSSVKSAIIVFLIVLYGGCVTYSFFRRNVLYEFHYRELKVIYDEWTNATRIEKRDGAGRLNVDLYPAVKTWHKTLYKKIPKKYKYIFLTDDTEQSFIAFELSNSEKEELNRLSNNGNLFYGEMLCIKHLMSVQADAPVDIKDAF